MSAPTVLVVGGTGTTGSRVAALLRDRMARVRIGTRSPAASDPEHVRFDWAEQTTHAPALAGATAVYLVAPITVADPVPLVEPFLADARRAGVRRVVLLSSSAVPDAGTGIGALPPLVRRAVPEWTVLRPSWFMQNFTGARLDDIRERGEIVTATGEGRVGFVDAADIAAVAARALLDPEPHNTDHVITGPEALSYGDAAACIAAATGRPVRHRATGVAELTSWFVAGGLPAEYATALARLDEEIRHGAEDRVTSTVQDVTGHPARSFTEFVAAHRDVFVV